MRNTTAVLIALVLINGLRDSEALRAQDPPNAPEAPSAAPGPTQQDAMAELAWLAGDWAGEGWIRQGRSEDRNEFTQTEHVESVFDGRILLVEGIGRVKLPDGGQGPVVHHAYGVLSWDLESGGYRFDTYLADEPGVDAEASVDGGVFTWGFQTAAGRIRFQIRQSETGEWHETGEFSPDEGTTWYPFFEMTLERVDKTAQPDG